VSGPGSYRHASRAPRYSLLFALPLLVCYQVLAALQPVTARGAVRNGADVLLETVFVALAGRDGPLVFMICLIAFGLWLVARDVRRHGGRLRVPVFAGMLGEAVVLALGFGTVVGALTSRVVAPVAWLAAGQVERLGLETRLMLSVGAGIYEELLFRVVLVAALAWGARALLGWRPAAAGVLATLVGAAVFSAVHYVGRYGDPLTLYSFVFRMIAGVFFSALYLLRGFGITAWTHALYDIFLIVT
jgi:Type II CAAX prenyl endopeptidase Rce1-like